MSDVIFIPLNNDLQTIYVLSLNKLFWVKIQTKGLIAVYLFIYLYIHTYIHDVIPFAQLFPPYYPACCPFPFLAASLPSPSWFPLLLSYPM